jgi:hypothetical protein
MRSSAEEALILLRGWRDAGAPVLLLWEGVVTDDAASFESHKFWGRCVETASEQIVVEGRFASIRIPLDGAAFEFEDLRNIPPPASFTYRNFESALNIRTVQFSMTLMSSRSGVPVPLLPPDIIQDDPE